MNRENAVKNIMDLVVKKYGIPQEQILEHSRKHGLIAPRKDLYFLLRNKLGLSYPQIGDLVGRDHTSVIHALKGYSPSEDFNIINFDIDGRVIGRNTFDAGFHLVQPRGGKWARLFKDRGVQCEIVGCGFNDVLEVHHFLSKKAGGTDEPSNLFVVCPNHHTMIHQDMVRLNPRSYPLLLIPSYLCTPNGG